MGRRARVRDMHAVMHHGVYIGVFRTIVKEMKGGVETELTRHSTQVYTADTAQMSCPVLPPSLRRTRRGWACCRRRARSAGVSGVWVRHLSAPEMDQRGIGGRQGRCELCRIGCHSDIGWAEGRARGKQGGNSARRWEASPSSHALGPA